MSRQKNTEGISKFLNIKDQGSFKNLQNSIKDRIIQSLENNPLLHSAVGDLVQKQNEEWEGSPPRRYKNHSVRQVVNTRYGAEELIIRKVANAVAETIVKQTEYENSSRYLKLEKVVDKPILGRKTRTKKS